MGFISTASTVTVTAKLTDAGKKKLFNSIESNSSGFISKFVLGDSDADYNAISAGYGTLESGPVPETTGFRPALRSKLLFEGKHAPGLPVLLVNDDYATDNGIVYYMSIGANERVSTQITLKTEWPKNEIFSETYAVMAKNPGNMSNDALARLFSVTRNSAGVFTIAFNGNATDDELETLIGTEGSGNYTDIPISIVGNTSHAFVNLKVQVSF